MVKPTHACGNPHCKQHAKAGQLACRRCWYELPKPLRNAIWSTWRGGQTSAYSENIIEARRIWSEAHNGG